LDAATAQPIFNFQVIGVGSHILITIMDCGCQDLDGHMNRVVGVMLLHVEGCLESKKNQSVTNYRLLVAPPNQYYH
jgi:hypothetical protein